MFKEYLFATVFGAINPDDLNKHIQNSCHNWTCNFERVSAGALDYEGVYN